eukprot:11468121-Ditylum_brightwellii.AAC.2
MDLGGSKQEKNHNKQPTKEKKKKHRSHRNGMLDVWRMSAGVFFKKNIKMSPNIIHAQVVHWQSKWSVLSDQMIDLENKINKVTSNKEEEAEIRKLVKALSDKKF